LIAIALILAQPTKTNSPALIFGRPCTRAMPSLIFKMTPFATVFTGIDSCREKWVARSKGFKKTGEHSLVKRAYKILSEQLAFITNTFKLFL
jgi:hypothetical protein